MHIAFYAPLKSPNHPVPSGDRQMARLLIKALEMAGHRVTIISEFRSFHKTPEEFTNIQQQGEAELARLRAEWLDKAKPDIWLTYHVYYKSPDLLGPELCREWAIPYVTAEASYSARRNVSGWQDEQALVLAAIRQAAVNVGFTQRDRDGLIEAAPEAKIVALPPFIDTSPYGEPAKLNPRRLVTVAMMRSGDKLASYEWLARALQEIKDQDWTLTIVGDGPERAKVEALFATFDAGRIEWLGQKSGAEISDILQQGGICVWPGIGEAYGISYLEAQAAGLPVVAFATAGVPEVVRNGVTGVLVSGIDSYKYSKQISTLLNNPKISQQYGFAAREFVLNERSLKVASTRLDDILQQIAEEK